MLAISTAKTDGANDMDYFSPDGKDFSAFTAAELGTMLPERENVVTMFLGNGSCQIAFQESLQLEIGEIQSSRWGAAGQCIQADTEADARAKMLIYLLENGLMAARE
jgi:hypothetical protein